MPSSKAHPPTYELKITLIGIEPPIWRRIQVPSSIKLCCLHSALQVVVGWTDSHLHKFEKDGKRWGVPEHEDSIDESKAPLAKVLKSEGESMIYVYDFGDNWRHEVMLEKVIQVNEATSYSTNSTGSWSAGVIASFDMRTTVISTFAASGRGNG